MEHADAGSGIQREVEQRSLQANEDTVVNASESSSKAESSIEQRARSSADHQPHQRDVSSWKSSEDFRSAAALTAVKSEPLANSSEGVHLSTGSQVVRRYPATSAVTTNSVTPPSASIEAPISPRHSVDDGMLLSRKNATSLSPGLKPNRKRGVPHVYRDYSNVPDTTGYVRKKTGGVTQPFPEKLHELLERENEPAVISWLPHGRAFLVRKPKEFTNYVMPKYFRQTKLTSFQRQLNLYGFRRITQGPDGGAYYHELFLRGRPQLCMRMQRQKVKGTGHKQPADAQTEPNFYSMPSSQALPPEYSPSKAAAGGPLTSPPCDAVSPGLEGVHDAAALLQTIQSGAPPFSLGASAAASSEVESSSAPVAQSARQLAVSAPLSGSSPSDNSKTAAVPRYRTVLPTLLPSPPSGPPSMSLLGRIAQTRTSGAVPCSPPQQGAFIWPPVRQPQLPILKETSPSSSQFGVLVGGTAETKVQQPSSTAKQDVKEDATSQSGDPKPAIPTSTLQKGGDTSKAEESSNTLSSNKETAIPAPPVLKDRPKDSSGFETQCPRGEDILPATTKYASPVEKNPPSTTHHPMTTPIPNKDPPTAAITSAIVNGIQTEEV